MIPVKSRAPTPSAGSSIYCMNVRVVYIRPFKVVSKSASISPAGIPPTVPVFA